jgi:peptidoglycan/xylan/chitin deacetylase (PgdA/CDA1 family)
LKGDVEMRGRYVHLSFDDGFANVAEVGGPTMHAMSVPFVIFLPSDFPEMSEEQLRPYFCSMDAYAAPIRPLTWNEARSVALLGGEVGSHTRRHLRLSDISCEAEILDEELRGSKERIQSELGASCRAFAWPYGTMSDIDAVSEAAMRNAGYEIAFSAVRGRIRPGLTNRMAVPRHQVEFHWPEHQLLLWARGFREK